jgi:hypothetical protein
MPRWSDEDDWEGDLGPDGEADDTDCADGEDDEPTVPCPYCGKPLPEDAPRCPYCDNYISREDAPPSRKPWWIILGVLAGLYAIYRLIAG